MNIGAYYIVLLMPRVYTVFLKLQLSKVFM